MPINSKCPNGQLKRQKMFSDGAARPQPGWFMQTSFIENGFLRVGLEPMTVASHNSVCKLMVPQSYYI